MMSCYSAFKGTVLPGVTKDSILHILREKGYKVKEEAISIDDLMEYGKNGRLKEAWGTGTAAVVSPMGELFYKGESIIINDFLKQGLLHKCCIKSLPICNGAVLKMDTAGCTCELSS